MHEKGIVVVNCCGLNCLVLSFWKLLVKYDPSICDIFVCLFIFLFNQSVHQLVNTLIYKHINNLINHAKEAASPKAFKMGVKENKF